MIAVVVSKHQGLVVLKSIHQALDNQVVVITCDDRQDVGRSCFDDIFGYCDEFNLQFYVLTGPGLNEFLLKNSPRLCFVSGWYWMIDESSLEVCELGCFGIHNSLLPKYRGGAPLVWSMINGDPIVGASVFRMVTGMDDGEILHQWRIYVNPDWVITDVLASLESFISRDLGSIFVRLLNGEISPVAQSDVDISYVPQRRESDSEIDWEMSAEQLFNHSRALQPPYPRLFFFRKNVKYQIYALSKASFSCLGRAGKILSYIDSGLVVKCGVNDADGVILLDVRSVEEPEINLCKSKYFSVGAILS